MEYIKKLDLIGAAVEVEYLGRPRLMVSVARIGNTPSVEIVCCGECRKRNGCVIFEGIADENGYCSMGERSD